MDSRRARASRRSRPRSASASRPSKPSAPRRPARKSRRPGSRSTCRNAGTVNRGRSCRRARCSPQTPGRAMPTSTAPWPATSAAAAPIRVFALPSRRLPASRKRRREMNRRHFLTATSAIGGGLLLGFGLPTRGEIRDALTSDAPFAPNAFLRIDRAGKVTFVMPMIEMGQGTYTSLPMLIAEELEVDVDKVAIEHSPPDDKVRQSAHRPADDRRLDLHSSDVRSAAPRGCYGTGDAGGGGRTAVERGPVDLHREKRRGRTRRERPQAWLRTAGGRGGKAPGAREGRSQGARGLQAGGNPPSAPRPRRQGQWPRELRH